ncbi:replication-associated protein [Caerostris darwini]|uniref:ATP-dependent helicase Rep n=1 Tax=Caerostris darwini TaxID=1538125 RepID=A0AAV4U1E0_9ARAC|nr:replication-associated protein [Caerostris darwini]
MAKKDVRSKQFCFTSFAISSEPVFKQEIHEYLIFGRETCPSSKREHWQGFVVFKNRQRFSGVQKSFPGSHIEVSRGTCQEAADYCKKDGNYKEFGRLPTIKQSSNPFKDVLNAAERGEISTIKEEYPALYLRYKTNILSSVKFRINELNGSCGVWICGPPRCGKDSSVRSLESVYMKNLNKWWDGYENERFVLICDVEPDHGKWLGYFLKIWTDRYAFNAEIKGGHIKIRPEKVFVTSNFMIEQVFSGEILQALLCRFSIINEFTGESIKRQEGCLNLAIRDKILALEDGILEEKDVSPPPSAVPGPSKENVSPQESDFQEPCQKRKKETKLQKGDTSQRRQPSAGSHVYRC